MLASAVISALSEHGWTVAVAESLTGGLVCATLVDVPGASVAVRGGVVAYATDLKCSLLGVSGDRLARTGPVDPEVAAQMAQGVRERLGADFGVATTGVAGPGPSGSIPAGTVFVAVAGPACTDVHEFALAGDRAQVRAAACEHAVDALAAAVEAAASG